MATNSSRWVVYEFRDGQHVALTKPQTSKRDAEKLREKLNKTGLNTTTDSHKHWYINRGQATTRTLWELGQFRPSHLGGLFSETTLILRASQTPEIPSPRPRSLPSIGNARVPRLMVVHP